MKQKFSKHWKASRQPRKQRKYRANAPLHIRHKMMSANLNKELRKKYGKRSFPLRKGDKIKIMRGEFRKKTGKIEAVDLKKLRVMIEGIFRTKKDGTKVGVYFDPSNLQIQELNLDDSKRKKAIEKKTGKEKPIASKELSEKPVTSQKSSEKESSSSSEKPIKDTKKKQENINKTKIKEKKK